MKKTYTYSELHNQAVTSYHKMMMSFLFIGILNVIGAIMGVLKNPTYFPSLVSNVLLFHLLSNYITNIILRTLVNGAISMVFSAIFLVIWVLTKNGNLKAIIIGLVLYFIDTILLLIFQFDNNFLIPQLLLHILMIVFIGVGIANYYHIFAIEKKFKK